MVRYFNASYKLLGYLQILFPGNFKGTLPKTRQKVTNERRQALMLIVARLYRPKIIFSCIRLFLYAFIY